jgi:hypothetical protein
MSSEIDPCEVKSAAKSRKWMPGLVILVAVGLSATMPAAASAHGPVAPIASSYLARVGSTAPGTQAQVIDGDQRMWLRAPPDATLVVIDYRGAPYLRFSARGVAVNTNSAMYYLNQTPVAEPPPPGLSRDTLPHWLPVTSGHVYSWHDGRLHALAAVALAPGSAYVGSWRIPLIAGGRPSAIAGGLFHADHPPLAWFWPIVVGLACLPAAWRLRRPELDRIVARILEGGALVAITAAAVGVELHGRPGVSAFGLVKLAVVLVFVAVCLWRMLTGRSGYFSYFVIGCAALWAGVQLIPTLLDGFVLAALPALLARIAAVVCLATGVSLLLLFARLAQRRGPDSEVTPDTAQDDEAWEYA